ncbi:hypothetical protein [Azonexus sp.]|uniref:hypothetical protein n=1 Tax=Azonexus sp. TaxID=1872668 RepID=UPI0027B897C6|nr:hypothetical protein [Azonexus sp.]
MKNILVSLSFVLFAAASYAQVAPFAPYSSCKDQVQPQCFDSKKSMLMKYYASEIDIVEEKARRLRYYDLVTDAETKFVIDARMAAAKEQQLALDAATPALRTRHLENAKREQVWADKLSRKFVGGTPETHREHRNIGRNEIETKFDEDLRVFREYRAETWR